MFSKASRKKAKLRLALAGVSGSGKTMGALLIAKGLGGKIAAIDTEKGSLSLYANVVGFDVCELSAPFSPEAYVQAIKFAEDAGYEILIIDSISHEWGGEGGCLEINDKLADSKFKGNNWRAWSETTPRHNKFLESINKSSMHIIATVRSKMKTESVQGNNGKSQIVKVGLGAEQRDGIEYEFTTVLDISHQGHFAVASKDRTGLFSNKDPFVLNEKTGASLLEWLNSGEEDPLIAIEREIISCTSSEQLKLVISKAKAMFGNDADAMERIRKAKAELAARVSNNSTGLSEEKNGISE